MLRLLNILPLFVTGATPSQYGLVFGLSPLTAFTFAPIFGRYGSRFGLKHLFNTGVFMYALAGLAFGFLDFVENVNIFLGFSYFLRYFQFRNSVLQIQFIWNCYASNIIFQIHPWPSWDECIGRGSSETKLYYLLEVQRNYNGNRTIKSQ